MLVLATAPAPATAQLSDPCGVACGLVLGATGFTFATGTVVAYGRETGGISTISEGLGVWGTGFVLFVGSGIALSGNGGRQERAVYGAGIGALTGSLLWLGVESTRQESSRARKIAASLMGAAVGALAGGVYGALSHDGAPGAQPARIGIRLRL